MPTTERSHQSAPAGPIRAARRAGSAYQANREALEPLLRLLLDAAALAALMYRRSAGKADEPEPQGVS